MTALKCKSRFRVAAKSEFSSVKNVLFCVRSVGELAPATTENSTLCDSLVALYAGPFRFSICSSGVRV